MTTRRKKSDEAKTVTIKDERNGSYVQVTTWGRFNKLGGRATIRVGCSSCCDAEDATISLEEAHKLGRQLLALKPAATLKEMTVDA